MSYFQQLVPLFTSLDMQHDAESFAESCEGFPRETILLFSAHVAMAEIHNGGFLQLFWNHSGILTPDAIEGFLAMGMPQLAAIVQTAADRLGRPFPRDRDDRWDALLAASDQTEQELDAIFEAEPNLYLAFAKATVSLGLTDLSTEAKRLATTEANGFQASANAWAAALEL